MRQWNPISEGLKKHRTAHALYLALKVRANADGLMVGEWDWYRARQKEFEPEVYEAEMQAADHRIAMRYARKLSVEDLQAVLAEKLHTAS